MNITFKKESDYSERYSANWTDATGRYHVWIVDGKVDPVICKNPLQRPDGSYPGRYDPDYFNTRKLDLNAKAWVGAWLQITTAVANGGALRLAAAERQVVLDAEKAAEVAKVVADRRAQLRRIAVATGTERLTLWLEAVGDDVIAALPRECF